MDALLGEEGDIVLNETGCQWTDLMMGVECSYLRTLIRILAALFSFWRLLPGIPMSPAWRRQRLGNLFHKSKIRVHSYTQVGG